MPTNDEILAKLADIISDITGRSAEDVQLDKSLTNDLDIDSLSMVEIVGEAEDAFDVQLPESEIKNLDTVGDVVNFVQKSLA